MEKEKFYTKTWFVILMIIFIFPVGLFLMWKYNKFSKTARIIISAIFAISFIGNVMFGGSDETTNSSKTTTEATTEKATAKTTAEKQTTKTTTEKATTEKATTEATTEATTTERQATTGEENALSKAYSYLDYSAFSKKGLIKQLEYEGFSNKEAKYAVKKCGANWKKQAYKKAQEYLDNQAFSKSGLINQLKYEGFTSSQAKYGANKAYK
ncbi:MAG: Ltp family lipoprotein [Anaerostipes sp.]|nr:Ltp family lipoprotein [Anaerostipes sp.]